MIFKQATKIVWTANWWHEFYKLSQLDPWNKNYYYCYYYYLYSGSTDSGINNVLREKSHEDATPLCSAPSKCLKQDTSSEANPATWSSRPALEFQSIVHVLSPRSHQQHNTAASILNQTFSIPKTAYFKLTKWKWKMWLPSLRFSQLTASKKWYLK